MQFTVHYDEAVVRSAVNTFVKRRIAEGMGARRLDGRRRDAGGVGLFVVAG